MNAPANAAATELQGQIALVTGAGRGIGRACSEALADAGAQVIAVARTAADLDSLREARPGLVETWREDVTATAFHDRVEALPRLDILVNNAGGNTPQPMAEVDDVTLQSVLKLNVEAAFRTARAAVRVMLRQKTGGAIINMSSQMGHVGCANRTVYCMTKHALEGLTRAMAVELAPHGIRVNAVAPTFVETSLTRPMLKKPEFNKFVMGQIPMGKLPQVEDIAAAVLFLASSRARLITGDSLRVDGGWTAQ